METAQRPNGSQGSRRPITQIKRDASQQCHFTTETESEFIVKSIR